MEEKLWKVAFLQPGADSDWLGDEIDLSSCQWVDVLSDSSKEKCVSFALQFHQISNIPHVVVVYTDTFGSIICKLFLLPE